MSSQFLLGLGWRATQYPITYDGIPVRHAVTVQGAWAPTDALELGLDLRLAVPAPAEPSWAFEVGPSALLAARLGAWHPASGLELGWSTRHRSEVLEEERPPGSYFADMGTPWPLWLDARAEPLRFDLGEDWQVGAFELGLGVSLPHLGLAGRWAIDVVSLRRRL